MPNRAFIHRALFAAAAIAAPVVSMPLAGAAVHRASSPSLDRTVVAQINAVRAHYGLGAGALTHVYDAANREGAQSNGDPALPRFRAGTSMEYGLWGAITLPATESTASATAAVVDGWVYHDGWQGSDTWNLDCTSPTAPLCNGHRRAVLSRSSVAGSHLAIDVATAPTTEGGAAAISLAVLMIWTTDQR
jgi:hypothetical protein